MEKNGLSQGLDLNKFEDSEGITLKKMNIGLWLVSNRRNFIWGFIVFLIVVSAALYGYTIYGYVDYLFFGGQRERLAIEELTKTPAISEEQRLQSQAKPLENSVPQNFSSAGNSDFLTKLNNPNDKFFVKFDYCFTDNSKDIACANTFLLPTESRYVAIFNSTSTVSSQLGFRMFNMKWERLNAHIYPDWKAFYAGHINFSTSDALSSRIFLSTSQRAMQSTFSSAKKAFKSVNPMLRQPISATPILSEGLLQLTVQGIIDAARVVPATAPDFFTNDLRFISSMCFILIFR